MAVVYSTDKHGRQLGVEEMLKQFNKKVQQEGIMNEVKKRECFVPNSVKRKLKIAANRKFKK